MYVYLDKGRNILALTHEEIGGTTGWGVTTPDALTAKTGVSLLQMEQQLRDSRGIPVYCMDDDGYAVRRTQEEMDADYVPPESKTSDVERIAALEAAMTAIEEGIASV